MDQYYVTGMSCAACQARVEKAVSQVPGVSSCSVSLLTNSMGVEGTASARDIISAVEKAGYGASLKGAAAKAQTSGDEEALRDRETPVLKKRLIASLCLLVPLMYITMGHMMWSWPLPAFFDGNPIAIGLTQMLLALSVMIINQRFFTSGFQALWHRAPNMDSLVSLGASASFAWSLYVLFKMTGAAANADAAALHAYMMDFYFESAAMILTLITVGKLLEARAKGKTTDALKSLMRLSPKTAVLLKDGKEVETPIGQVVRGDVFIVRPGASIPVDGRVLEGESAVNEAALTGESIPVDKAAGDAVSAATINQSGYLKCEATRVGEDTTLSQIIRMVGDAAATKAPIAKVADKVSGVFVPVVIAIALVTVAVWLLLGRDAGYALARGISVLVISCPCALGLATPVAIMVGNGVGAKRGILFKTAASLEQAGRVNVVALDKTGTITKGDPEVTDVLPAVGVDEKALLEMAASIEQKSEHPLAKAILREAEKRGVSPLPVEGFAALPGNGLSARMEGRQLLGGSVQYIQSKTALPDETLNAARALADAGKTPLLFARDGQYLGAIAVADTVKEDSPEAIRHLREMGIRVVMLTGDNLRTAQAIGRQAGVDEVIAGVLPDGKERVIRQLQKQGRVAMVGDGINDAPALTRADTGIAIGAGADVAIDAADVVLVKSRLSDVPAAVRLSRATLTNIHENLFWAFIYNVIGIPLAAGAFTGLFGWSMNPMFGAAAMSLSSFCVVSNALRLNFIHLDRPGRGMKEVGPGEAKVSALQPENLLLRVAVGGMMCSHCEATVKAALEAIPGVVSASASHEAGTAAIVAEKSLDENLIRKAVEAEDYEYKGMLHD